MKNIKKIFGIFILIVFVFTIFSYAADTPLLSNSAVKIRKYLDKKTEQEVANENEEGAINEAIKKLISTGTYLDITKYIPKLQKAEKIHKSEEVKNSGLIRTSDKFYNKVMNQNLNDLKDIDIIALYYEYEHYKPILSLDFNKNEKVFKKISDEIESKKVGNQKIATINKNNKTIQFLTPPLAQMTIDLAKSKAQESYNNNKEETDKEIEKESDQIWGTTLYNQPENQSKGQSTEGNLGDVIKEGEDFVDSGSGVDGVVNIDTLQNFSKTFYNIFLEIGIAVAVIVGIIIGVKFMVSSADKKADIKQLLVPYIVGCVVVFGSFGIWKLAVEILGNV